MTPALKLELLIKRRTETVQFQLTPSPAGCERVVHFTVGETTESLLWKEDDVTKVSFPLKKGSHILTIEVEGTLPIASLTLPKQTVALCDELPPLVDPETWKPAHHAQIWNRETPPENLERVSEALFMRNPQIADLTETFAHLPKLKSVPKLIFLTLTKVRSFNGLFKESGIESIDPVLFSAAVNAIDFREIFASCKSLKAIPKDIFKGNLKAWRFDSAFEESGLSVIPAELFNSNQQGSSFTRTFANCPITKVPDGFLAGVNPSDVDGMFEMDKALDHDPLKIKAAPRFPASFFLAIRNARGVPSFSDR